VRNEEVTTERGRKVDVRNNEKGRGDNREGERGEKDNEKGRGDNRERKRERRKIMRKEEVTTERGREREER
jgi:hypothetical protein